MITKYQNQSKSRSKKPLAFLLCLFIVGFGYGQNLVPNAGFEEHFNCPNYVGQFYETKYWSNPTTGSPDYFNSCDIDFADVPSNLMGYQNARTGDAYAGFFAYYKAETFREYLQVKLNDTLINGQKYFITFFVSLADSVDYATDDIGLFLSPDSIYSNNYLELQYSPQVVNQEGNLITNKLGWTKISGTYISQGNESWITIGNFKSDSNTDTISGLGCGASLLNDCQSAYYYLDDVCISTDSLLCNSSVGIEEMGLNDLVLIFPNPFNETAEIKIPQIFKNDAIELQIFDYKGCEVHKFIFENLEEKYFIKNDGLDAGIYSIRIKSGDKILSQKFIID